MVGVYQIPTYLTRVAKGIKKSSILTQSKTSYIADIIYCGVFLGYEFWWNEPSCLLRRLIKRYNISTDLFSFIAQQIKLFLESDHETLLHTTSNDKFPSKSLA